MFARAGRSSVRMMRVMVDAALPPLFMILYTWAVVAFGRLWD